MIADEVKSQVAKAMEPVPSMVEEAVQQLFCPATTSEEQGIRTVLLEVSEHVALHQIRKAAFGKTIN